MAARVWTREKLVAEIVALHAQGADLSPTAIQKTHGALFSSARSRSHFGNWRSAISAAGLDYSQIKRIKLRWSRESIVAQILVHHAAGEDLLQPEFKMRYRSLYLAACAHRYFGSWRRALLAAELDFEKMRESRTWTRARIQRTIEEATARGESLNWSVIEEKCPGIYRAARRPENFGSWQNALLAAGLVPIGRRRGRKPYGAKKSIEDTQTRDDLRVSELQSVSELARIGDRALDAPAAPHIAGESRSSLASSPLSRPKPGKTSKSKS